MSLRRLYERSVITFLSGFNMPYLWTMVEYLFILYFTKWTLFDE